MIDYNHFGPHGPRFQELYEMTLYHCEREWNRRNGNSFEDYCRRTASPEIYWVDRLMAMIGNKGTPNPVELIALWQAFHRCIHQTLESLAHYVKTPEIQAFLQLYDIHISARGNKDILELMLDLNPICHGPWTEDQLNYVARNHRQVLQVGCGSGYLLSALKERGVHIRGCDNNRYFLFDYNQPWTRELQKSGEIVLAGSEFVRSVEAGTTLLLSWPEPGSNFPFQSIQLFREAGGRKILFMEGGFLGVPRVRAPSPLEGDPHANQKNFLEELGQHWLQKTEGACPPYEPLLFGSNIFEFEVKR